VNVRLALRSQSYYIKHSYPVHPFQLLRLIDTELLSYLFKTDNLIVAIANAAEEHQDRQIIIPRPKCHFVAHDGYTL
jgi:hypothetical protein